MTNLDDKKLVERSILRDQSNLSVNTNYFIAGYSMLGEKFMCFSSCNVSSSFVSIQLLFFKFQFISCILFVL